MNWDIGTHTTTQPGGHRPIHFIRRARTVQEQDGKVRAGWESITDPKSIPPATISPHMGSAALKPGAGTLCCPSNRLEHLDTKMIRGMT